MNLHAPTPCPACHLAFFRWRWRTRGNVDVGGWYPAPGTLGSVDLRTYDECAARATRDGELGGFGFGIIHELVGLPSDAVDFGRLSEIDGPLTQAQRDALRQHFGTGELSLSLSRRLALIGIMTQMADPDGRSRMRPISCTPDDGRALIHMACIIIDAPRADDMVSI